MHDDKRRLEKHPCTNLCASRCKLKTSAEVFYYLSEKIPPSNKLYATSEGAISHNMLYYQLNSPLLVTN